MSSSNIPTVPPSGGNESTFKSALKWNWETILKLVSLVAVVLYGLGLFVANAYLTRFGITDFELLKPQCLFTGLWSIGYLICAGLPSLFAYLALFGDPSMGLLKRIFLSLIGGVVGVALATMAVFPLGMIILSSGLQNARSTFPFFGIAPQGWGTLLGIVNVLMFVAIISGYGLKVSKKQAASVLLVWFLLVAIFASSEIGYDIYPTVSRQAGGGRPENADFLFSHEGDSSLIAIRQRTNFEGNADSNILNADLIYSGKDDYILRVSYCSQKASGVSTHKETIAVVEKKDVSAIFPLGDSTTPTGSRETPCP
jgi:hypothetical protein